MKTVVERALELASDGKHRSIIDIRTTLKEERYVNVAPHLAGKSINVEIRARINESLKKR